jgi:methionyl-tRNA formyltransferase
MKLIYLGSAEFGIDCLNALHASSHSLELIVTQPPHPAGRGRKLTPTPVATWAKRHNIEFLESENVNTPEMLEKISSYSPDLTVVVAFGQKIGDKLIDLAPNRSINVHPSLLPKYRGAAPINWPIINGDKETGVSIITLVDKMDAGQVLLQGKTEIEENESAGHLHDRLAKISADVLLEAIERIADGTATFTEQEHDKATLAKKLRKSDGFIDFNDNAETILRKILGFWPWPEASAHFVSSETGKCRRVIFAMAEVLPQGNPNKLAPGILDEDLNVMCAQGALKITKIKPAGGQLMDFRDFINGFHCKVGDFFMQVDR